MTKESNKKKIDIELDNNTIDGVYSNLVVINHSSSEFILDFATLTGAVVVALGHVATGIMGTNERLIDKIKSSSNITGEKVWEFPLWDE